MAAKLISSHALSKATQVLLQSHAEPGDNEVNMNHFGFTLCKHLDFKI